MYKAEVVNFFGGRGAISAVAKLLGVTHGAVSQWTDPIPKGAALELEKLTKGALKCDLSLYKNRYRKNKHVRAQE
ncbi:Cro/CI family transcriptional regulator [Hafnia paralvei]|uniref:Cro/CI family transcriptional regulator n=1 Tax=Hafnia paralvei TaxID=546367 RepID=UPI0010331BE2|nr:Cro/CI family transcriptional regulator [Hafnia paralvei]TBL56448.1 hypothetical protein EYY97_21740 [Hafnia paralvei]